MPVVPVALLLVTGAGDGEGLSRAEVEEIVKAALADIPRSQPGLTSAEAGQIARGVVASIPPRSAPTEYTKFVVDKAIARFHADGLEATLEHYNSVESVGASGTCSSQRPKGRYWDTTTPGTLRYTCKRCSTTGPSRPPKMGFG